MGRLFGVVLLLLTNASAVGQADLTGHAHLKKYIRSNTYRGNDPAVLVNEITKGLTSSKDKFDAIFVWVATNLHYDFANYYSSGGTSTLPIKMILRSRRGVCLHYATLMDSLCKIAGITNVTVPGYAKDELFDVNDSIYIDNHAWNAVKIDSLWYLYDVTWSSGSVQFKYTLLSRLILNLHEKLQPRYKTRRIKSKKTDCGKSSQTANYFRQPFLNRLLINLLYRFRLKIKKIYTAGLTANYYLCHPEVFSITHFPDNPAWSLLPGMTMRNFESDSAFYHYNDSLTHTREKAGTACTECDKLALLNKYEAGLALKKSATKSNPRNEFVSAACNFEVAEFHLDNSRNETDSLAKVTLLDSALLYFEWAKTALNASRKNISADFRLQRHKNQKKQKELLSENKTHTRFVRKKVSGSSSRTRLNKAIGNRFMGYSQTQRNRNAEIQHYTTNVNTLPKTGKHAARIERLSQEITKLDKSRDSLDQIINSAMHRFDSLTNNLSLNVWQKGFSHDSLLEPFRKSIYYRTLLLDNYKKPVRETRIKIYSKEKEYDNDLDALIYSPSDSCTQIAAALLKLLDRRHNLAKNSYRKKTELAAKGEMSVRELEEEKTNLLNHSKSTYCWLEERIPFLNSISMGFAFLRFQQRNSEGIINYENHKERLRVAAIKKELKRRRNKYNTIINHNNHLLKLKIREVKRYKKSFQSK